MNNIQILMMGGKKLIYNYGYLYNWHAGVDSRKLAPVGFLIPTDVDWTKLTDFAGGGLVAGGKLKEVGTKHWFSPNAGATDEYGFTALPGGGRHYLGAFSNIGTYGYWYGEDGWGGGWIHRMNYDGANIFRYSFYKTVGNSIRCFRHVGRYGALYNWYAAVDSRNIAPTGCHVPTDAEWTTLVDYLGGREGSGGKMKEAGIRETGSSNWSSPNYGATNRSGFLGLPNGNRRYDGVFSNLILDAFFWSSTESDSLKAFISRLSNNDDDCSQYSTTKDHGFSVRCICNTIASTITDIDGNVYDVIDIGSQRWLVQDLKTTKYRNGDTIPNVTDNTAWAALTTGGMCYYNNAGAPPTATQPTTLTDYDGNVYGIVQIGRQLWTNSNLKVTHYNDGTVIPNVTDGATWAALTTGALCAYNNDNKYV